MNLPPLPNPDGRGILDVVERRESLSLTEWATLGLLAERPRHGYDIATELSADAPVGQVWHAPRHAVYRALDRLTDLGHAETRRIEAGDAAPQRTVYGTTRRGRRALHDWLDTPVDHLRDVRSEFLLKLAPGDEVAPLVGAGSAHIGRASAEAFLGDHELPGLVDQERHDLLQALPDRWRGR